MHSVLTFLHLLYLRSSQIDNIPYTLVVPDRGLFFPSVDEIRVRLNEAATRGGGLASKSLAPGGSTEIEEDQQPKPIIVDMRNVMEMDYTAAAVS